MEDQIIINSTTLDKIELPRILYKYRMADNEFHRNILKSGRVYYSPPNGFEDELDCKIPVRWDLLTDEEIFEKYYTELRERNPWMGHFLLVEEATQWVIAGNFRNQAMIADAEVAYRDLLNRRFGVLSLTEDCMNPDMWKKYSNALNGFCIGFDGRVMLEEIAGGGGQVTYVEELPVIKPFIDPLIQNQLQAFNKEKKWAFEKEYRSHKTWPVDADHATRNMRVPNEAFIELIIGEHVFDDTRQELIKDSKLLNPNISIKTATQVDGAIIIQ
jgi:hypothetical protein